MDDQYVATTAGRLALREYEKYRRATDAVTSTAELLNHLPNDSPIGTDLLKGASVTMGAEHAPDQALAPSIDLFERATRMRGLAPVVLSFYPNLIAGRLSEGDITAEIIAESDVLDVLPELPSIGDAALSNTEGLSLYESHRELPYALWLMETPDASYTGITAYDSGGIAGLLMNDSDAAVRWAEEQYESYLETASSTAISEG